MLEHILQVRPHAFFVDELHTFQLAQARVQLDLDVGDALQQPGGKFTPDDGGGLQDLLLIIA